MPGLVGADVDQLRVLSRRFADAADQLRRLAASISARLDSIDWIGPDAGRFRAQWQGESAGQLRSAAAALTAAAEALQRNADEQEQASSASGGLIGAGLVQGPAWGWPGAPGAEPWFLRPDGGLSDPGQTPMFSPGHNGAGPQWGFPNPFNVYRDLVEKTPIWPISVGTAVGMTPAAGLMNAAGAAALAFDDRLGSGERAAEGLHFAADLVGGELRDAGFKDRNPAMYLSGAAVSQWSDVVHEFAKADFRPATVATTVDFVVAHPGEAFAAAGDAVRDYLPKLVSNFSFNPFGK